MSGMEDLWKSCFTAEVLPRLSRLPTTFFYLINANICATPISLSLRVHSLFLQGSGFMMNAFDDEQSMPTQVKGRLEGH